MIVDILKNSITVSREASDPVFYKDESWFWYRLAQEMKRKGLDVVKKLAYKDGHLLDNYQYYLRDRKWRYCIIDNQHALRNVAEAYTKEGTITLSIIVWEGTELCPLQ